MTRELPPGPTPLNLTEATRADRYVDHAGQLLTPGELKGLCTLDDGRAAASIVFDALVISATIAVAVWAARWWVTLPALVVIGARQHGIAILMHDAAHHRMFRSRPWNDLVGRWLAYVLGASMLTYRAMHVRHHNHVYEAADPDLPLYAAYPKPRAYLIRKLLRDAFGLTLGKNVRYLSRGIASTKRPDGAAPAPVKIESNPELEAARRRDRSFILLVQAMLLVLAFAAGVFPYYLLYWTLPSLTVLQVLLRARAIAEHGALPDRTNRLLNARTVLPGMVGRFFIAPHHVNYHLEHHLWPGIPHYRLADAHRMLKERGALEGIETPHSYGEVWRAATAG